MTSLTIGGVARASGCHIETIRYYERIGLLPAPARSASGYRHYQLQDVERLRFIARGRELGFSLDEIRSLLQLAEDPGLSCVDVDTLARQHLADIKAKLSDLQRMADELQRTIAACHGGQRAECTILEALKHPPRGAA
ncbi:MerR family transcriptional regulator [Pseudomarimonas arenosa]|uniref:Helix-turn-helix domain-containing protein n=1 Tax=Pseudomarimonas arenosa TaxID=2774145 RepID=A0AAW3ZKC6_9GAMM|nr:helix-turn-helix domain-containing protein [Pseudomarimonas arenosa]MBD8525654.1 helix-turn-helix domain-containing protein [Pseudomarimonas arenosa]